MRVLYVDFQIEMPTQEYTGLVNAIAAEIAKVPGLIHKTWIINEQTREAGGLYLFEDQQSLEAYVNGPILSHLREMKQVKNVRTREYDVLEAASVVTRGIANTQVGAGGF